MPVSVRDLERSLSVARLQPYRSLATNDRDALCLYLRNMELSYALYPVLQSVEVVIRNSIHGAGTRHFGATDWLRNGAMRPLNVREQRMLDTATDSLWERQGHNVRAIQAGRIATPPLPPTDDHIAALMFGFWTSIMNAPYQRLLWDTRPTGINLIHAAFPHAGRKNRQRAVIFPIINSLRSLRNRISHHEPILRWQPSLGGAHGQALDVLRWASPSMHDLVRMTDPFPILSQRPINYHAGGFVVVP